jgi:hypothetical protein
MPIDVTTEQLISLREAARNLPARRQGKKPHVSCLYRWTTRGCRGVVLESVSVGGTRCTSREALARFIQRLSAVERSAPADDASPIRRRKLETIERQLGDAGLGESPTAAQRGRLRVADE